MTPITHLTKQLKQAADEIENSDSTSPGYVQLFRIAANEVASNVAEIERLKGLLRAYDENFSDCDHCKSTGIEPETKDDSCERCGGYGFNPGGDIREIRLAARAELAKAVHS